MRIICPHGKTVEPNIKLGITVYYHTDGSQCAAMNNINVSAALVDKIVVRDKKSNPAEMYAMCVSKHVVANIVKTLSSADSKTLERELKRLSREGYFNYIGKRLVKVFGDTLLKNLEYISEFETYRALLKYCKRGKNKQKVAMVNIPKTKLNEAVATLNKQRDLDYLDDFLNGG